MNIIIVEVNSWHTVGEKGREVSKNTDRRQLWNKTKQKVRANLGNRL